MSLMVAMSIERNVACGLLARSRLLIDDLHCASDA